MVKKYRKDEDISYAFGATVTMELLNKRPQAATAVYVSPKSEITAVSERAKELNIPIIESEKAFNILSPKDNCYVIGAFKKFAAPITKGKHHIVLVNPSNTGNLGTIMRMVAAFDRCDLAIIRPSVDPFEPKTVRASMGAIFDIKFSMFDTFEEYIMAYPENKPVPFMLNGSIPFSEKSFAADTKYSLVFGNEASGLPIEYSKYGAVMIEQSEKVDSLNLSAAVAIALYKLYTS